MLYHVKKILLCCTVAISCATSLLQAQVKFDFEEGSLSDFLQDPDDSWIVKDTTLLGGGRVLQHLRDDGTVVDKISFLPRPNPSALSDAWSFSVCYAPSTATSTNNYWLAFLASNVDASAMSATGVRVSAYAVGVYNRLGGDTLKLFKISSGIITPIIAATITTRGKKLAIKVTRSALGEWTLFASDYSSSESMIQYGKATEPSEIPGENFGFLFAFSATNYRNFFADELEIDLVPRPLKIAAVRRSVPHSLQVEFSKAVDTACAVDASYYSLSAADGGGILPIDSVKLLAANTVEIFISKIFTTGSYTLTVQNLPNSQGTKSDDYLDFRLDIPHYGDVVFSELMVRPNVESDLPDEYIELYNRTYNSIDLTGWTIASAARTGRITSGAIEPNSYALIGNVTSEYASVLAVTGRPQLTDGGASLSLSDGHGVTVTTLSYNESWYADEMKKMGGYSLEKIDLDNLEENASNWRASNSERGGTPGEQNSVAADNTDVTPPKFISFRATGNELSLHFSEAISEESLNAGSFALDNGIGNAQSLRWSMEKPMDVTLIFARPLEQHVICTLSVKASAVCDLAQNCMADFTVQAGFGEAPAANDVVINEVLFNPHAGGVDFVELYNRSEKIAELEGLRLANRRTANGAIDRSYALPAYTLFPREYVVVTTLPDVVREQYSCPNPEAFITLAALPSYPNEEGCVALLDSAGVALEDFYYSEKMHSGIVAIPKGISLERINPHRPASE
ncbi:MAG: lamin tail domain-containing protein, partial [Prevotellaceae bacterium]|nr:lamin tail domain-containing protein [Prevotellaceae bacterium]